MPLSKFMIEGGLPLKGEITIGGAKNAALPILCAVLLTAGKITLKKVPDLEDVNYMISILRKLGVEAERNGDVVELEVRDETETTADYDLVRKMRASVCVLGPLTGKRKRAKVSLPGGCVIGVRPIDLHLKGLSALGAKIEEEGGYVIADGSNLRGAKIYLGGAYGSSVTGTANVLMAAVLAKGTTVIESAACEPELIDLADFLNKCGAKISGAGSPKITIVGVENLHGCEHEIIPDRIEAGTFLVAGAITCSPITIRGANPDHLTAFLDALSNAGIHVWQNADGSLTNSAGRLNATDLTTHPYPGFPTDLQAQMMALLSIADGISVLTEKIYPDRFVHVMELNRLGAQIRKEGPSAIVMGTKRLSGAPVMASDLRASAALVLAGLAAKGTTEVLRVYHIDRGYEKIEEKLAQLGARIRRVQQDAKSDN